MARVYLDPDVCLGHKVCVEICPEDVFGWGKAKDVGLVTRIKLLIESRGYQAYVADEAACTACMACVTGCPEAAIEVVADEDE